MSAIHSDPNWTPVAGYLQWLSENAPCGLQRVIDALPGQWIPGNFYEDGRRCLMGHAEDWNGIGGGDDQSACIDKHDDDQKWLQIAFGFDDLCEKHGLEPVVEAVKAEARRLSSAYDLQALNVLVEAAPPVVPPYVPVRMRTALAEACEEASRE